VYGYAADDTYHLHVVNPETGRTYCDKELVFRIESIDRAEYIRLTTCLICRNKAFGIGTSRGGTKNG
jgi:hypothetical protein